MVVLLGSLFGLLATFKSSIATFIMKRSFNKKLIKIVDDFLGETDMTPVERLGIMKEKLSYKEVFATVMQVEEQTAQIEDI